MYSTATSHSKLAFSLTGKLRSFSSNTNIYFGTTAEPLQNRTDPWHVERIGTDYSALFMTPQMGFASVGNLIEPGPNSVILGTFTLEFYPAKLLNPAPRVADTRSHYQNE